MAAVASAPVLTRSHRLTSRPMFALAVRRGRRAGTGTLVVHLVDGDVDGDVASGSRDPQVGFIVSRAVGSAVTRNAVKRRLRHLVRERLDAIPRDAVVVVRALPAAATAAYSRLADDFDTALARVARPSVGTGSPA